MWKASELLRWELYPLCHRPPRTPALLEADADCSGCSPSQAWWQSLGPSVSCWCHGEQLHGGSRCSPPYDAVTRHWQHLLPVGQRAGHVVGRGQPPLAPLRATTGGCSLWPLLTTSSSPMYLWWQVVVLEKMTEVIHASLAQSNFEQVLFDNIGLLNYGLHKGASCIGSKWENWFVTNWKSRISFYYKRS